MNREKIVTIGGGTGSYMLLTGLKKYQVNLTAIVSMADDGGSTGMLRDELGVLPPGDVRQCLVALSDAPEMLRQLFLYRFDSGRLKGHNFGNLFLSALEKINDNFEDAIKEAERILRVRGTVIPVTIDNARLEMRLRNGKRIKGESAIYDNEDIQRVGIERLRYSKKVTLNPRARHAIQAADTIIIGPGDFYSSIVPNLIVTGMSHALRTSKAKIIFVSNLTNKRGQTSGYHVRSYLEELRHHLQDNLIDYVLVNTGKPPSRLYTKYLRSEGSGFLIEHAGPRRIGTTRIIARDLLNRKKIAHDASDALYKKRSFIRHDSGRLAQAILDL